MARLTDDERAFFEASGSLTRDDNGRTVLRGLSYLETKAYLDHWRIQIDHREGGDGSRDQFLVLHRRHLQALGLGSDH